METLWVTQEANNQLMDHWCPPSLVWHIFYSLALSSWGRTGSEGDQAETVNYIHLSVTDTKDESLVGKDSETTWRITCEFQLPEYFLSLLARITENPGKTYKMMQLDGAWRIILPNLLSLQMRKFRIMCVPSDPHIGKGWSGDPQISSFFDLVVPWKNSNLMLVTVPFHLK